MQKRSSMSISRTDTSISLSRQLDNAIPADKIAALSSGHFVGMVADDPTCKIDLKAFHSEIQNNHEALKQEQDIYQPLPVIRPVDNSMVHRNFFQIKQDVQDIVSSEMEQMMGDPSSANLVVKK